MNEDERDASTRRSERLMKITSAIADAVTPEHVYAAIVDDIAAALGASTCALWTVDEEARTARLQRTVGHSDAVRSSMESAQLDVGGALPAVDALCARTPIWISSQAELLGRYPHLEHVVTHGRSYAIACLPIVVHDRPLGVLGLTFEGAPPLDEDAKNFLRVVARYAGQALERLRLLEAERTSRERAEAFAARMAALSRASRAFAEQGDDLSKLLDTIATEVTIDHADACAVMLISESGDTLEVGGAHHRDPEAAEAVRAAITSGLRVGEGGMGRVAATGRSVLLPVVDPEQLLADAYPAMRPWLRQHMPRSSLIVPMRLRGRVVGVIAANRERVPAPFDREDERFLEELGYRAAMAIESARLVADNQKARLRAELLYGLVRAVISADHIEQVYEAALDAIERALGTGRASVLVFDPDGVMRFVAQRGLSETYRRAVEGHTPWSRDTRDPQPIFSGDVLNDPAFAEHRETFAAENIGAIGFIPLVAEGRLIGKFMVYYDRPRALSPSERDLALAIANHVAAAVTRFATVASLEQSVRFNEMFTGILGHDLRNPLSAIMTAAHLAMMQEEDGEQNLKPLARILTSGQRMARMIDQLLDFTRMRVGGGIPLTTRSVELTELLREVLDELEDANPGCALTLDAAGDTAGTWDQDRLLQVFSNLIANAVQHRVGEEGVGVRVDGTDAATVRVEVHNAGVVPLELLPKIFDPMTAGDRRRNKSKGLGLGLYITRQIVLAHGGSVEVRSSDQDGTTFTVVLPRCVETVR